MSGRVVLETPRLVLRELTTDDAAFAFALNADPEVLRSTGDAPFRSVDDASAFLERYEDYHRHGMGRWGAVLRAEGVLVGWCGLKRDVARGGVDLGFRFERRAWGRGLATEAALACVAHGFGELGLGRIVGRAMEQNVASVRVLEKVGMRRVGVLEEAGAVWLVHAVDAP